jgi:ferritin-like metal-binding protein YciE
VKQLSSTAASRKERQRDLHTFHRVTFETGFMASRVHRCWRTSTRRGDMADLSTLHDLFEDELKDVYDAEKQILKALPKIIKAVTNTDLREALSAHLEETRGQVERLEKAFESLDLRPKGKHCAGMAGILEEGGDLLEEDGSDAVLDAGFIAGCQRVEHYEITAYGSLMAWAKILGYTDALNLLKANEQEEKAADAKLSKIAESAVNQQAASANSDEEEADSRERSRQRSKGRTA